MESNPLDPGTACPGNRNSRHAGEDAMRSMDPGPLMFSHADRDRRMEEAKDVLTVSEDACARAMTADKGVTEIPHFGPLYHFDIMKSFGYTKEEIAASCPVCEEVFFNRFTHLSLYGLSEEQLTYMADAVLISIEEMQKSE